MKKIYAIAFFVLMSGMMFAQTNVSLQINHALGAAPFAFNTAAANNNNMAFNVSRLEYYLSQITLIHDGGQQTLVPNTWILVNAGNVTMESLGSFPVTNLEAIRFGVGVEASVNHLDPSSYAMSHPLAPKSPSMHWGWQAGYRFVAMEGKSGNNFSQSFEIHALDDAYYYLTTIPTNGVANGNDIIIELNADYEMALKNVDVSSGPITHGGFGESITLLQNFRDDVFSSATAVGIEDELQNKMSIAPNPAVAGHTVKLSWDGEAEAGIKVYDLSGKLLQEFAGQDHQARFEMLEAGYYLIAIEENGRVKATRKLIITQ